MPKLFIARLVLVCSPFITSSSESGFDVTKFGAIGDGIVDDSHSIVLAIAAARAHSPSTVHFPEGKIFLTRPFNISSYITLRVDGTIRGITGNNSKVGKEFIFDGGWAAIPPLPSYGSDRDIGAKSRYQALIMAEGARSVAITGTGTIDGQGPWWWEQHKNHTLHVGRPHLVEFYNCTGVEVSGVTLRDSPFWTLHPVYCTDVHVHHVTIRARLYAPNADGVDPDSSKNVMIENCDISCGDDHVAIKSGLSDLARTSYPLFATENVTVRNNVLRVGMGISIGSETSGGIRNVTVHSNVIYGGGWSIGLHVKTTLSRGNMVENVAFLNNSIYNTTSFINLQTNYQGGDKMPKGYPPTSVRNISWIGNTYGPADKRGHGGWQCSVNDTCSDLTVVNNTMLDSESGWSCHYIDSYTVSRNVPSGLEECMKGSMNPKDMSKDLDVLNNVLVI